MQTILLVGFPNSGKSTIFNLLSGEMRKVANYAGITVDAASAPLLSNKREANPVTLVDLPGIYGLTPTSIDEAISIARVLRYDQGHDYHLIALVLDFHRLEASLSLALAIKDLVGERLVLIINKDDKRAFDQQGLLKLKELTGLEVISASAKHDDPTELDQFLRRHLSQSAPVYPKQIDQAQEFERSVTDLISGHGPTNHTFFLTQNEASRDYHEKARSILKAVLIKKPKDQQLTQAIDSVLIHPFWGLIIFCLIFFFVFQSIYTWAVPLMDLIDGGIVALSGVLAKSLAPGLLNSLLTDGILAGVGGVIIFLPQIMILFFLLSLLEQSGYIARAAVMTDRVMGQFGLNGKAFLPYISGFACAIPGIMAARTIPDKRERIATIMTIPFITCSARLPVYILLVGTFVPERIVGGIFSLQALAFFFLYFLGSIIALVMAKIFRLTYFKGESSNFIIDLPYYERPSFILALKNSYQKGLTFLKKAGTIILALSILIWLASTFPRPSESEVAGLNEEQAASYALEHSLLGRVGHAIEPALKPLGMDWKVGVGLIVAIGAREMFVSTLGTMYSLQDVNEESQSLRERMKSEIDPATGKPVYNAASAWAIMIFFVFALQCTATLAVLKKETQSAFIPVLMFGYMTLMAYVFSLATYQLFG